MYKETLCLDCTIDEKDSPVSSKSSAPFAPSAFLELFSFFLPDVIKSVLGDTARCVLKLYFNSNPNLVPRSEMLNGCSSFSHWVNHSNGLKKKIHVLGKLHRDTLYSFSSEIMYVRRLKKASKNHFHAAITLINLATAAFQRVSIYCTQ